MFIDTYTLEIQAKHHQELEEVALETHYQTLNAVIDFLNDFAKETKYQSFKNVIPVLISSIKEEFMK